MALSYNLGYQESISVHPTRRQILLANHTRLSPTSENETYHLQDLLCPVDVPGGKNAKGPGVGPEETQIF